MKRKKKETVTDTKNTLNLLSQSSKFLLFVFLFLSLFPCRWIVFSCSTSCAACVKNCEKIWETKNNSHGKKKIFLFNLVISPLLFSFHIYSCVGLQYPCNLFLPLSLSLQLLLYYLFTRFCYFCLSFSVVIYLKRRVWNLFHNNKWI